MFNPAQTANQIRIEVVKMITQAKSGHLASALGLADFFTILYFKFLKHRASESTWQDRDYFFMSNGHACAAWYATLALAGYFDKGELKTFRQINSRLQGHPHLDLLSGIENTSGSLGQGLSQACGLAKALATDHKHNQVICLISDAELQEGQTWEAIMFAAHHHLHNIILVIDNNNIQIEGKVEDVMSVQPIKEKLQSFGWDSFAVYGHDYQQIEEALQIAKQARKPIAIILKTVPGRGVSFMENNYQWHGQVPTENQSVRALEELISNQERLTNEAN
ncbi:MAG: transketolase [Patescibacteria group bacterium]